MMTSHHHSCPVVVAMPFRCVKHPGPVPPPTTASGRSPLCACEAHLPSPSIPAYYVVQVVKNAGGFPQPL